MESSTGKSKGRGRSGFSRRAFLRALGMLAFLLGRPAWLEAFFITELQVRTVEKENFRFDHKSGLVIWDEGRAKEEYSLLVEGMVEAPLRLTYKDLRALPHVEQTSDFHCVEGWSVKGIRWGGFRISELVRMARPGEKATHVVFHALGKTYSHPGGLDHYVESHPLDYLLGPENECLMTLDMNGAPLPHDHGAPMRLIAPKSLGYKNIKFVTKMVFAKGPEPGWWTRANAVYPVIAPVPEKRLRGEE